MSPVAPDRLSAETFGRLHPRAIDDRARIASLLEGWRRSQVRLQRGTNQAIQRELATIVSIEEAELELTCLDFGPIDGFLFLSTEFEGIPYFCSARVRRVDEPEPGGRARRVRIAWPAVIYRAERRDRARRAAGRADAGGQAGEGSEECKAPGAPGGVHGEGRWQRVRLVRRDGRDCEARVVDVSGDGLGVMLPSSHGLEPGEGVELRSERSKATEAGRWAIVRNRRDERGRQGWRRIGLSVLPEPPHPPLRAEPAADVLAAVGGLAMPSPDFELPARPEVVRFRDARGERIVGLLDCVGEIAGAPAVVIPSAWGKTKETLSGLAATILASFDAAGRPLSVLRFDGIRKRGESANDPGCDDPALGNLHYTFSQGATDLLAAARFLQQERGAGPVLIVSFSVASVEARRAIVLDEDERFAGWVSVVGATDPQSLIRVISGGVDYLAGAERGVRFGRQDVQGLLLDIDRTAEEALASRIAFLEDARRDFAAIRCPLTWITGTHDAWMDPGRIEDVLSFGPRAGRRLIVSETGHQLKSSREALEIFGLVASECARMLARGGRDEPDPPGEALVRPVAAEPKALRRRQRAERARLREPERRPDLRSFWKDYLVGNDESLGMELVTETSSYRALMRDQIEALELEEEAGLEILDLGSGVSTLERALHDTDLDLTRLRVVALDYVVEGIRRGRGALPPDSPLRVAHVAANLDLVPGRSIPLGSESVDRAIGSLLLNYLSDPQRFLGEVRTRLRPGGLLVLSALRRDADTSKICVDGVGELRGGQGLASFGESREGEIARSLGGFINNAARLLDLEEQGIFRFWDRGELEQAASRAGFVGISVRPSFGEPPQAWLLRARRPE